MTVVEFRSLALSFPNVEPHPHFDRVAFKVAGKRIFATVHEEMGSANVLLSPAEQSVFCDFGKNAVFPVPNKWDLQGWTTFDLKKVPQELMVDALNTAYKEVVNSKRRKK